MKQFKGNKTDNAKNSILFNKFIIHSLTILLASAISTSILILISEITSLLEAPAISSTFDDSAAMLCANLLEDNWKLGISSGAPI